MTKNIYHRLEQKLRAVIKEYEQNDMSLLAQVYSSDPDFPPALFSTVKAEVKIIASTFILYSYIKQVSPSKTKRGDILDAFTKIINGEI